MKDYLSISLAISSEQTDPDTVTYRVGLPPTGIRKRGTPIRNGMLRRPEFDLHEWWIRSELHLSSGVLMENEAETFITEFLDRFADEGTCSSIHALSVDHDVLVALVYHMSYMPYVGLTKRHVEAVARLGARIDYDFMVDELHAQDQG